ncbi:MAG: hypothetical protein ABI873_02960 [Marmoricola sp.]
MGGNQGDDDGLENARCQWPTDPVLELARLDSETPESIFATTPVWRGAGSGRPIAIPRRRRRPGVARRLTLLLISVLAAFVWVRTYAAESLPESVQILIGTETRQPTSPHVYTDGSYRFMATQPGSPAVPVGYNPCHPIRVTINFRDAPVNAIDLVTTTLRHINTVSGLRLEFAGASLDRPRGSRVGPVLVAWSNTTEDPALEGALGLGGSGSYTTNYGTKYYVSGTVTLDTKAFRAIPHWEQQAVVDHEFGHVVGLDHVDDTGQLMSAHGHGRTTFSHGDLTGLALLGRLPCA